jgi:1,4-alpha-glucan branching enzyme
VSARPAGGDPGEVAVVLHTHLPWLRGHGNWPVGEEWLFQAWGESWYPVTRVLLRLAEEGQRDLLTLGVTPLVAWQVADRRLRDDLGTWLAGNMWRAEEQRTAALHAGDDVAALGPFYWRHYADLLAFHEQVEAAGGLLAVWADLASRGVVELLGGPATHPYLPLHADTGVVDAQLATGLAAHAGWAGTRPTGIWAPEMGYRPRGPVADATAEPTAVDRHGTPRLPTLPGERPGLEEHYARHGISHFLVDAPTLVRAAGGDERDWTVRPDVPSPGARAPDEVVHDGVRVGDGDVVAFARDLSVAYHVWSPTAGYPGNAWYRDFFAHGSFGLHPSWRVTDKSLPPDTKATYEPDRAAARVGVDVDHLHGVVREVLDPRPGQLVVAAYDTELFGHWWFEGPAWLEGLLRAVHADPALRTTTLASRIDRRPPTRRLHLPESSWGYAKGHASWVTPDTRRMWRAIRDAGDRLRPWLDATLADPALVGARDQAVRELALLQCSDWPFMVTRGNAPDYADARFDGHLDRLARLVDGLAAGRVDPATLREAATLDPVPPDVAAFLDTTVVSGTAGRAR